MIGSIRKICVALACLFAVAMVSCVTDDDKVTSIKVGERIPQFSVVLDDGSSLSSSDLQGHRSLIVFFNTSCPDCRRELPVLQRVYDQAPAGSRIVCISREEDSESVAAYWAASGLTLPYSAQTDRAVYSKFASGIIPRIYAVDENLTVIAAFSDTDMPSEQALLYLLTN